MPLTNPFITTKKKKAQHEKTSRDIYFEALEEAYGNFPVPTDDWADIKSLLIQYYITYRKKSHDAAKEDAKTDIIELTNAIDKIHEHYDLIAKLLEKQQKYG